MRRIVGRSKDEHEREQRICGSKHEGARKIASEDKDKENCE